MIVPRISAGLIQQEFEKQCDELLNTMVEQACKKDPWKIYLAKGAGDRAIAGDHEERHLLELLQNARDAIYRGRLEGDTSPGRVLVVVTERGMAIANTGAPFRLHDEKVLEAVRFLMRSEKTGKGFIGHKGIGLKSILLRAGAFSVRSRVNDEVLRVTFSRYRTAQHLLDKMDTWPDDVRCQREQDILDELPHMPLFTQPHSDSDDWDTLGEDTHLVETLLGEYSDCGLGVKDDGSPGPLESYTTVVYLPYRDEEWEHLLNRIEKEHTSLNHQIFCGGRQQMGTVSKEAGAEALWHELTELDPRVLVLLGEITEIQFARFQEGKLIEVRRIDIEQPLSPLGDCGDAFIEVRLKIVQWSGTAPQDQPPQHRNFIVLSKPTELGVESDDQSSDSQNNDGPQEYIRILLEVPSSDHISLRNEPLFLYYPIEASLSGLPFLIHGPFRVNSSRTALAISQKDHNCQVLREAVDLLGNSLDDLLKPGSPLRKWLPWVLLPQANPEEEARAEHDKLQCKLAEWVVELLKTALCVPTTCGNARPADVYFFPNRPEALSLFEEMTLDGKKVSEQLCLLECDSRLAYQWLYENAKDRWVRAAEAIGLKIDPLTFAQELNRCLGHSANSKPLLVNAGLARSFFLGMCDLLSVSDKTAREAATMLGHGKVPLLPATASFNEDEGKEELLLVPTEPRREADTSALLQASRIVFWRRLSARARAEQLPSPPIVPVYFVDSNVIEAEGTVEGVLSTYYEEWGTTRFDSRPDLFRRVADQAVRLHDDSVLPVLGYLAGLLQSITTKSFSGAEDLHPRPYAAIDLTTLKKYLPGQQNQDRERLTSEQYWASIQVPVKSGGQIAAECAVFGLEWADFLEQNAQPASEEKDAQKLDWAKAIRKLASFRAAIGRTAEDPRFPEVASPDDPRWIPARKQLSYVADLNSEETSLALFRLLLLLGVRIGPRVEWRWLDSRERTQQFDSESHAINCQASEQLYKGNDLTDDLVPIWLTQSELLQAYRRYISLRPYHTAFSGDHSRGCQEDLLQRGGETGSLLAAWTWLPDLVDADLDRLPFNGNQAVIDAFRRSLVAVWPGLASDVLWTGWYCNRGWHYPRSWSKKIPSLAAFQLSQLELWQAISGGRLGDVESRRFPAATMIAWDKRKLPPATEPAGFFPLLDTCEESISRVAQDLEIGTLSILSLHGAVTRLRWLLEESRVGDGPAGCWQIDEFEGASRDAWLAAQYRLLERIVLEHEPANLWTRRAVLTCGLVLRAVYERKQWAIPLEEDAKGTLRFSKDVAFFPQPPRYWEQEEHKDKWILETQRRLQAALYKWAEALGATRLNPKDPPAYKGNPVEAPEAVAALQARVQDRLDLLLGVFKAHRAEKLDEIAGKVTNALEQMIAVIPPESQDSGWSGLDEHGCLVFSHPAYKSERGEGRSGVVVLAEGLALLVEQTTAVGDLQHALSAPRDQVERALRFRGVDIDELVCEVTALTRKRLDWLSERIKRLVGALGKATSTPLPTWRVEEIPEDELVVAIEELKSAEGALADQPLAAMASVAPDLPETSRTKLLQMAMDKDLMACGDIAMGKEMLAVLREAGWTLEKRARFAQADLLHLPSDLAAQQESCRVSLNIAVIAALAAQIVSGEFDGAKEIEQELDIRGRARREMLRVPPVEADDAFLKHIDSTLQVPIDFDSLGLLLVEWEEENWHELGQAFCKAAISSLSQVPKDDLRDLLHKCLEEGSLEPLGERHSQKQSERQKHISALERSLEGGSLSFDPAALFGFTSEPPLKQPTSETFEAGRGTGGGNLGPVTVGQAVRGRLAELFVLEVCWQRFLGLDVDERARTLDAIETHRQANPGDVPWGTGAAWKRFKPRLDEHRDTLCQANRSNVSSQLVGLFKDLIEVANEGGPGFDVLDPFGIWGELNNDILSPRRVEVKAILPSDGSSEGHPVVFTTNEFHRARQHPESYVLRLIYVPRNYYENVSDVRWACDIPDPVNILRLDKQIVLGVRSGVLPFQVRSMT
ncbi:MAG: hypothetical protein JW850_04350 [Thermoflexales bacterium]|nr:hypothetical protein [Thermoflexales bacterium]